MMRIYRCMTENEGQNMKWIIANLKKFLYLSSAIIPLAGLGSAALISLAAMNDPSGEIDYEVMGGFIYPNSGGNSKKYSHDLQLYGGQAAVLADEFMRWFAGLWHGKSLAYTVAGITVFMSIVSMIAAKNLPSRLKTGVHSDNKVEGAE